MGFFDWLLGKKAPQPHVSPEEFFVGQFIERLRSLAPRAEVRRTDETLKLIVGLDGRDSTVFLGNLMHDGRELDPEARQRLTDRFLSSVIDGVAPRDTLEQVRDELAVCLRGAMHGTNLVLAAREFLPCLREHLVVDGANNIAFVTEDDLARWKLSLDDALEIGRTKLREARTGEELHDEAQRIWAIETGDDYESSRLLVPGFLASFRERVRGRVIAVAPTRTQLHIAGDEDPAVVLRLCEFAEREFAASPRRLSAAMYSVDEDGRVIRYVRSVQDEAAVRVAEGHVRFEGTEYSRQKHALEEAHQANGTDVFVASFSGLKTKGGQLVSWASVAPGVHAWVPRTDLLAMEHAGTHAFFRFDDVLREVPRALVRHPTLFPPRWVTQGDFTPEELARLTPTKPA